jgi:hypothetical protein
MVAAGEAAGPDVDGDIALLAAMYRTLTRDATGAAETLEPPAIGHRADTDTGKRERRSRRASRSANCGMVAR